MKNSDIRSRAWEKTAAHYPVLVLLLLGFPFLAWVLGAQLSAFMPPLFVLAPALPVAVFILVSPVGLYFLAEDRLPVGEAVRKYAHSGRLKVSLAVASELLARFFLYTLIAMPVSFYLVGRYVSHLNGDGLFALILLLPVTFAMTMLVTVYMTVKYQFASFIVFATHLGAREAMRENKRFFRQVFRPLFSLLLGFIGWDLLCTATWGLAAFWVVPYKQMALALFFGHHWNQYQAGVGHQPKERRM